jgi:streptogramin lyase
MTRRSRPKRTGIILPGTNGYSLESRIVLSAYVNTVPLTFPPDAIASGPGGVLAFTGIGLVPDRGNEFDIIVGTFNPLTGSLTSTAVTLSDEFPMSYPSGGITGAADGNFWYAGGLGSIGSIQPTTLVHTDFPLPAGGLAYSITSDFSGNLWFTDAGAGKIGEINLTTHVIQEFPLSSPSSVPNGIALGPNGNLWFTESGTSMIGEINPTTHVIQQFPTPTANANPQKITLGADGNLWFSEAAVSKIGKIDPTTGISADFAAAADSGVAPGADGEIWFTSRTAGTVSEINLSTDAVTTVVTGLGGPASIVLGIDGNMWVGDGNSLGQIVSIPSNQAVVRGTVALGPAVDNSLLPNDGLSGRTVYLDLKGDGTFDAGDPSATTNFNGAYTITGAPPGTYALRIVSYPGDSLSAPPGGFQNVTLTGGQLTMATTIDVIPASSVLPLTYNPSPFGTSQPDVSTAEVTGLYATILGRAPDPAGLAFFVGFLKNGGAVQTVAYDLLNSTEFDSIVVKSDYLNYLDHVATPTEINAWVTMMQAGLTVEQVASDFLNSDVYSALHPDNASFVTALYVDLAGYTPNPTEVSAWDMLLASGVTRATAVQSFMNFSEPRALSGLYSLILDRSPDQGGLTFFGTALANGVSLTDVAALMFGSAEYARLAGKAVS